MTIRDISAGHAPALPHRFSSTKLRSLTLPGNIAVPTQVLGLLVLDAILLAAATGVALWGRSQLGFLPDAADVEANVRPWAVALTLGWLGALGISGAPRPGPSGRGCSSTGGS